MLGVGARREVTVLAYFDPLEEGFQVKEEEEWAK
jgi:hypothetical protein